VRFVLDEASFTVRLIKRRAGFLEWQQCLMLENWGRHQACTNLALLIREAARSRSPHEHVTLCLG
jgi:hypothetical protein